MDIMSGEFIIEVIVLLNIMRRSLILLSYLRFDSKILEDIKYDIKYRNRIIILVAALIVAIFAIFIDYPTLKLVMVMNSSLVAMLNK